MGFIFSKASKEKLKGVHPDLVKIMETAITDSPYDFRITHGVRTTEEQKALYAQGRTKAGKKVTNVDGVLKKSNHQVKSDGYGHAVDIFLCGERDSNGIYTKYTTTAQGYDAIKMRIVGNHIKLVAKKLGIRIIHGIDWKMVDAPHFELK